MNMKVLSKSRKKPKVGDVFALQVREGEYFFGCVIKTDARIFMIENCLLIYIYEATSPSKSTIPLLHRDQLLLPPLFTNYQSWFKGYFETVAQHSLREDDILPQHCFLHLNRKFYDEYGRELSQAVKPVGEYALQGYRSIDGLISNRLGIPLSLE